MTWATGKPARGFTLIELLLVLTLLAVVLAVTLPSLTGFSKRLSQKQSVDAVRNSLLQVRRLAIERGEVMRWDAAMISTTQTPWHAQVIPAGPIEFLPCGVCSEATVQLLDEHDAVYAVLTCSAATGNILSNHSP